MRTGSRMLFAAFALLLPWGALAETPMSAEETPMSVAGKSSPPAKTLMVGDVEVSALQDRPSSMPISIFRGPLPEKDLRELLPSGSDPASVNVFLMRAKKEPISIAMPIEGQPKTISGKNILVDSGWGAAKDGVNHLEIALQEKGLKPVDIDIVLVTHTHPDHIGGLTLNGEAFFPNAQILVSKPEYAWSQGLIADGKGKDMFDLLKAYKDRLHQFAFNPSEFPHASGHPSRIFAWAAPGHTPGQATFLLRSGDDALLFIGDLLHGAGVQFAFPEEGTSYDADLKQASVSRQSILNMAADEGTPIAAAHIPFPGVGIVEKTEADNGMVEKTVYLFSFLPGAEQEPTPPNQ